MNVEYLLSICATEIEHRGVRVLIVTDVDSADANPQDNDNAGTLYSWARDFDGDERIIEPDLEAFEEENAIDAADSGDYARYFASEYGAALTVLVRFSGGSGGARIYPDTDDPNCALCFTQTELETEFGGSADDATRYALPRIEELDLWLRGEVYGVVALTEAATEAEAEIEESLWGLIGDPFAESGKYLMDEARELAATVADARAEEAEEAAMWAARGVITTN